MTHARLFGPGFSIPDTLQCAEFEPGEESGLAQNDHYQTTGPED